MAFHGHFTELLVVFSGVLLFPEMHLGPFHAVEISVQPSDLFDRLLSEFLRHRRVSTADRYLHGGPFLVGESSRS